MQDNHTVIEVMRGAVAADAENVSLRLHLADLLIAQNRAGEAAEALAHAAKVLESKPDNLLALGYAAAACRLLGKDQRADSYRRLHDALSGLPAPGKVPPVTRFDPASAPPAARLEPGIFDDETDGVDFADDDAPERTGVSKFGHFSENSENDDAGGFWEIERPQVKLSDVGGMEAVKKRLNSAFLAPLRNPEIMEYYGKKLRGGLLLYGPPGCGKTFIAKAIAGELGAKFFSVGLADVLDMWTGSSEKNIREIFQTARRNSPCVVFFDELDALGRKRALVRHGGISGVVNQLLTELDSVNSDNEGVSILAATNHPWDVDSALRRPGRLDRMMLVLPPDRDARLAIMQMNMAGRPAEKIDYRTLARRTEDFSGADVVHLCETAAENAMEESLAAAQLDNGDIEEAAETAENLRALAPDSADALSLSGSIEFARNDPYAAKEYFTAALRLQPDSFLAMHNLGVAEIHTFNFDEAIEVLRRALELDPVNAGVKQNLDYAVSERDRELRVKLRPYWLPVILLCAYLFTLPLLEANWRLLLPGAIVALLAVGGYFLTFKFRRRRLHPNVQMAVRMHAKTVARDPARRLISDKLMPKLAGLFITTGLAGALLALYLAAAVLLNSRISELPPIILAAAGASVLTAVASGIYIGLRRAIFRRVADLLIKEYRAIKNDGSEEE